MAVHKKQESAMTRTYLGRGVGLVDDDDVGALEVDIAGVVCGLLTGAMGVCHTDPQAYIAQSM